jgi:hypothetical protein
MSVQKYVVSKESSNFTIIPNKVIKGLSDNLELLGFYAYLLSLPPSWIFYKSKLKKSCGLGVKKLERFLKQLAQMNLIVVAQNRNEVGQFAHFDLTVLNGDSFKINNIEEIAQPCVKNRTTDNGGTVKNTYKRNIDKINNEKRNISCAFDNARNLFDEFWSIYPRKKDKARAGKIWTNKKLDKIADKIIADVKNRIANDVSFQEEQFILYPSTYLKNERWNDEITNVKNKVVSINQNKPNELKSTVKEWGPGHPTYDSMYNNTH